MKTERAKLSLTILTLPPESVEVLLEEGGGWGGVKPNPYLENNSTLTVKG